MPEHTDQKIRQRAYEIWETNNCVEGQDWNFWLQAECEILGEYASIDTSLPAAAQQDAPQKAKPATKRKTAAKPRTTKAKTTSAKTTTAKAKAPAKPRARKAATPKTAGTTDTPST